MGVYLNKKTTIGGGWNNYFWFSTLPGKWSNLTNIFQMGWNHQPDKVRKLFDKVYINHENTESYPGIICLTWLVRSHSWVWTLQIAPKVFVCMCWYMHYLGRKRTDISKSIAHDEKDLVNCLQVQLRSGDIYIYTSFFLSICRASGESKWIAQRPLSKKSSR